MTEDPLPIGSASLDLGPLKLISKITQGSERKTLYSAAQSSGV